MPLCIIAELLQILRPGSCSRLSTFLETKVRFQKKFFKKNHLKNFITKENSYSFILITKNLVQMSTYKPLTKAEELVMQCSGSWEKAS